MRPDVIDLREFYGTRLGQVARKFVRYRIRQLWPDLSGLDLLALGYPTPYLRQFQGEARRVVAFMPAQQGVHRWHGAEAGANGERAAVVGELWLAGGL